LIAEVADYYFRTDTDYEVVAFANAKEFINEPSFLDRPVVPFEDLQESHSPQRHDIFVALGYAKTNQIRQQRYAEAKQKGFTCASYLSSRALYYGKTFGDNCFILENNVIQPFVTIGNNVTLWSGNHIGHHSTIRDHCFISSHVVVSGSCLLEENCFLGVNCTLRDNITLGKYTVVSSAAAVMKSCGQRSVVTPAKSDYRVIDKDII
jgi:sugar O-acyltransferase (sialic acid O-acetyltransferase NeuD family)